MMPQSALVCEGWLLKKRRRKMQGFARRYFTLDNSGLLSYSFQPGHPVRDHVSLHHAAISTAPGRKDIHIDSNAATFHVKCLSTDDFNMWMAAFRKFISSGQGVRRSASVRLTPRYANANFNVTKFATMVEEMGSTIIALEQHIRAFSQESATHVKKSHNFGRKSEKEKPKDSNKDLRFGIFRKASHQAISRDNDDITGDSSLEPLRRVFSTLEKLKSHHVLLLASVQTFADSAVQGSPLPRTVEEENQPVYISRLSTPLSRRSKHASIATSVSDSVYEWFDASDGAEEFVMDVPLIPEAEQLNTIPACRSRSSLGQEETSSIDTELEEVKNQQLATLEPFQRRRELPSLLVADEGSLFAILKKNVGKDLSTITFPVTFNEPLTLLQRAAEEVEYCNILQEAAKSDSAIDRMCYVAAFAVSSYAHTRHRTGRKAFNPMLGETFEEPRMHFIAEKVRHNPLEIAYHAEGDGWVLNTTSSGRTKFWGKSLEIIPLGVSHLKIGNDHYVWNKPSSFMRNLMVGTKYLEHSGKMTIENKSDDMYCVLEFKQSGYWGPSNIVTGSVHDLSGDTVMRMEGKWDDQMAQTLNSSNLRVLWRMTPFPTDTHDYYGFTSFGITLNELTPALMGNLPPTDSRFRPDVRALENGELDEAENQKCRIEEMQRARRREGKDQQPRWFHQEGDEWIYSGGYWEARRRNWKDEEVPSLW